jgi:hypothetical protein
VDVRPVLCCVISRKIQDASLYLVSSILLSLSPYWYFRQLALKIPNFMFLPNDYCVQQLNAKRSPESVTIHNEGDQRNLKTFQNVA